MDVNYVKDITLKWMTIELQCVYSCHVLHSIFLMGRVEENLTV